MANQFAVFGDDTNVEIRYQNYDSPPLVTPPETDVMHAASIAQGDATGVVDAIVTHTSRRE